MAAMASNARPLTVPALAVALAAAVLLALAVPVGAAADASSSAEPSAWEGDKEAVGRVRLEKAQRRAETRQGVEDNSRQGAQGREERRAGEAQGVSRAGQPRSPTFGLPTAPGGHAVAAGSSPAAAAHATTSHALIEKALEQGRIIGSLSPLATKCS